MRPISCLAMAFALVAAPLSAVDLRTTLFMSGPPGTLDIAVAGDGTNQAGPAPKPLAWFQLSVAPDDGQLVVDLADEVATDFRLTLG